MRHYPESFERIIDASKRADCDQRLFLVHDVGNKFDNNAIMLHDGQRKLGYVAAAEAPKIRKILDQLAQQNDGQDQVLVVKHFKISNEATFCWKSSISVTAIGYVHERIARKAVKQGV